MKPIQIVMDYIPQRKVARNFAMLMYKVLRDYGAPVTLIATGFEERGCGRNVPVIREFTTDITDHDMEFMNKSLFIPESSEGLSEREESRLHTWNKNTFRYLDEYYLHREDCVTLFVVELDGRFYNNEQTDYQKERLVYENGAYPYLQCPVFNDKITHGHEPLERILMPKEDSNPLLNPLSTVEKAIKLGKLTRTMAESELGIEAYTEIQDSQHLNKA